MTFFEQELKKLFEQDAVFSDMCVVGNTCFGRLNDDVRVKIGFATSRVADQYDQLKVSVINRREGEIDSLVLRFRDVWGIKSTNNPNFADGIAPHIWKNDNKIGWYVYKPDKMDYRQLAEAVSSYLGVFQEPIQEQQLGQRMY